MHLLNKPLGDLQFYRAYNRACRLEKLLSVSYYDISRYIGGYPQGERVEALEMDQSTIFEISNKADYQSVTPESTALFTAAMAGSEHGVKQAIKAGGKVNYYHRPEDKTSALHVACENGSVAVVQVLIENDALIDIVAVTNKDTPLVLAAGAGHNKIVTILISKGANVNHQNAYGNSALHQASKHHHLAVCQSLINAGANVDLKNNKGSTPLMLACLNEETSNSNKDMMKLFKLLIDSGANVNEVDNNGASAFHAAASSNNVKLLECLLESGANAMAKDSDGRTPLKMAEFHNHELPASITAKLT